MAIFKKILVVGDICGFFVEVQLLLGSEGLRLLGEKVAEMFPPSQWRAILAQLPPGWTNDLILLLHAGLLGL